jgi:hypothetical protein
LVKRLGCTAFKGLVENNKLLIHDAEIISEISTFIEVRGTHKADEGYHDDLVMTLVLLGWAANDPFFKELTDSNLRKVLFEDQAKIIEEELTPFGIIDNGITPEIQTEVIDSDIWFREDPQVLMEKIRRKQLESV